MTPRSVLWVYVLFVNTVQMRHNMLIFKFIYRSLAAIFGTTVVTFDDLERAEQTV